ncbi:MAG: hypothetical protein AAFN11_20910 [Chloroflexota bacterium]
MSIHKWIIVFFTSILGILSACTTQSADALLYDIVRNGGRGAPDCFYPMPAFSEQLTDAEILAVLFYIKTMWTNEQRQQQIQLSSQ